MVRTQIQLPDALYRDVKRFASNREWSVAETFRRAVEYFLSIHSLTPTEMSSWTVPVSDDAKGRRLTHEEIREAVLDDIEGHILSKVGADKPPEEPDS